MHGIQQSSGIRHPNQQRTLSFYNSRRYSGGRNSRRNSEGHEVCTQRINGRVENGNGLHTPSLGSSPTVHYEDSINKLLDSASDDYLTPPSSAICSSTVLQQMASSYSDTESFSTSGLVSAQGTPCKSPSKSGSPNKVRSCVYGNGNLMEEIDWKHNVVDVDPGMSEEESLQNNTTANNEICNNGPGIGNEGIAMMHPSGPSPFCFNQYPLAMSYSFPPPARHLLPSPLPGQRHSSPINLFSYPPPPSLSTKFNNGVSWAFDTTGGAAIGHPTNMESWFASHPVQTHVPYEPPCNWPEELVAAYRTYGLPLEGYPLKSAMGDGRMQMKGMMVSQSLTEYLNPAFPHPNPNIHHHFQQTPHPVVTEKPEGRRVEGGNNHSEIFQRWRYNKDLVTLTEICSREVVLLEFAFDQHGSRFLQDSLLQGGAESEAGKTVFQFLIKNFRKMVNDVYGNYIVQKYLEIGSNSQKKSILEEMRPSLWELARNQHGCRVLQKALEAGCYTEEHHWTCREMLLEEMKANPEELRALMTDANGNHVIQKTIEVCRPSEFQFLVDTVINPDNQIGGDGPVSARQIAEQTYGCRVIQKMLQQASQEQKTDIINNLLPFVDSLTKDPYGNYVVQHMLMEGGEFERKKLMKSFKGNGNIIMLSQHKHASNVVEKAFETAEPNDRKAMVDEIFSAIPKKGTQSALEVMLRDSFANYVIQTMIRVADMQDKLRLLRGIKKLIPVLSKFNYGKHILAKLEKDFKEMKIAMCGET